MDPSDSDERYLSDSEGTTASTCSEFTCDQRNDLEDSEVWNCDSLELDVETALDVLSTYDYGLEAKKLIDQGESRESVETAEALLKGGAEPYTVTATSIESAQAMLEEEAEPPRATAESAEADQKVLKKEVESSVETAGILEIDQEIPKEKVELLTAFAKSVETAQALLEEVERFTASTKSAETAQEIMEDDIKPLTETVKCIETAKETVGEEAETLTALASTELETAVSDYVYSEYSLPPSETNAEIEFDVIAKASPLSTAVSGSVSWYSMPRSETEVEPPPILYVGGIRVVDSIECLHRLPSAILRPVENFDNLNNGLIWTGGLTSEKETDEGNYEYSYYSNGPSETNVTMDDMDRSDEINSQLVSIDQKVIFFALEK